tara:strand:+ start:275 stop:646 length:372 start_codon:yes stop_codon:yes gene_type:complete
MTNDTYKNIEEFAEEMSIEGLITADGYDEAFIGVANRFGKEPVAVYSYEMCIQILMRDSDMSHEEALEFFEYNTIGAFISENQPIYIHFIDHIFKPVKTSRVSHLKPHFSGKIDNCPEDWLGL